MKFVNFDNDPLWIWPSQLTMAGEKVKGNHSQVKQRTNPLLHYHSIQRCPAWIQPNPSLSLPLPLFLYLSQGNPSLPQKPTWSFTTESCFQNRTTQRRSAGGTVILSRMTQVFVHRHVVQIVLWFAPTHPLLPALPQEKLTSSPPTWSSVSPCSPPLSLLSASMFSTRSTIHGGAFLGGEIHRRRRRELMMISLMKIRNLWWITPSGTSAQLASSHQSSVL